MMPDISQSINIYYLSEQAVTIEFGNEINNKLLRIITDFNTLIHQNKFAGFCSTVPAYTTLTVFYDPLTVYQATELSGTDCFEKVSTYLIGLSKALKGNPTETGDAMVIPVYYGAGFGPDLAEVASLNNLTVDEVISIHTQAVYKVYMIGFVPGFAYLGGMSPSIAAPRKQTPRAAIAKGAVGIAGNQTGIYPLETPGGWQIIGQTPLVMFDANRAKPALLKAGDTVQFKSINLDEFNHFNR